MKVTVFSELRIGVRYNGNDIETRKSILYVHFRQFLPFFHHSRAFFERFSRGNSYPFRGTLSFVNWMR